MSASSSHIVSRSYFSASSSRSMPTGHLGVPPRSAAAASFSARPCMVSSLVSTATVVTFPRLKRDKKARDRPIFYHSLEENAKKKNVTEAIKMKQKCQTLTDEMNRSIYRLEQKSVSYRNIIDRNRLELNLNSNKQSLFANEAMVDRSNKMKIEKYAKASPNVVKASLVKYEPIYFKLVRYKTAQRRSLSADVLVNTDDEPSGATKDQLTREAEKQPSLKPALMESIIQQQLNSTRTIEDIVNRRVIKPNDSMKAQDDNMVPPAVSPTPSSVIETPLDKNYFKMKAAELHYRRLPSIINDGIIKGRYAGVSMRRESLLPNFQRRGTRISFSNPVS